MRQLLRRPRLVPLVLVAAASLFVLKMAGLIINGGYTLGAGHMAQADRMALENPRIVQRDPRATRGRDQPREEAPPAKLSWAQEMFNYPDVTGSVGAKKDEASDKAAKGADGKAADGKPAEAAKPADPKPAEAGRTIQVDPKPISPAERALLERLQERRQELDQRARELDMRETLLQNAQKQLDGKLNELTAVEERIQAATAKKEEADAARFKSLVTMYESMKAKDAAKIFDRLEMRILVEVAHKINPRRMSDILAQMSPETAERLTVELATRNQGGEKAAAPQELPKIEGIPRGT